MSFDVWRQQAENLKQELKDAIAAREESFERTIPNYICVNNLKSKLNRLEVIERILAIDKYLLVFIGTIGEGKTTAICHLFNLIGDFEVSKTIAGKSKTIREAQELLSTGSGRTTICEVIIKTAERTYLEIDPYTPEEMENMIVDFCESLSDDVNIQGEQRVPFSKEVETAIRNVIKLSKVSVSNTESEKSGTTRVDKAKEELEKSGLDGLKSVALQNANLANRMETRIAYDGHDDERTWIKRNFARLNNAELPTIAIPRKISLYVSDRLLPGSRLSSFEAIVDTKGIDENPNRKDLEEYINRADTICLFATNFKDAPETNIRELMRFNLSSRSRDFHHRFVTFVLPHKGEPEKVNGGDGSWEVGSDIRREDIQAAFRNLSLEFFPSNILFYDALRYYRSETNVLNSDSYTNDDILNDRNACLEVILSVIQQRRNILLDETNAIQLGFQKIKEGDVLSSIEVHALENAVRNIKNLRDLGKRIPSFVYEEFVEKYVLYFRNNYRAWNTKHAINRRFGIYDMRNIDIYYDAGVVAQGESDEEMLRKFTKEVKLELEGILGEMTKANEALEAFIPDLIKQLNADYDDFIGLVGTDVEAFLRQKLSPQTSDSDFWQALINEKGKQRPRGETYTDNVCQTYLRELETSQTLNAYLAVVAGTRWSDLVSGVLGHFGE